MFTVSMSADTPVFERPLAGIFELGSFWPSTNTASRLTSQRLGVKNKNKTPIRSAQAVYMSTDTTLTAGRSVTKATATTDAIGQDQQN